MADADFLAAAQDLRQSSGLPAAGPAAVSGGDPDYMAAARDVAQNQRGQAAMAIGASQGTNADAAGLNTQLGRQFGVPATVVDAWPQEFRERAIVMAARDTLNSAPIFAHAIASNPRLAALVHDDVPNTAAMEQGVNDFGAAGSFLANARRSLFTSLEPFIGAEGFGGTHVTLGMAGAAIAGAMDQQLGTHSADLLFQALERMDQERERALAAAGLDTSFAGKLGSATGDTLGVLTQALGSDGASLGPEATRLLPALWQTIQHGVRAMTLPAMTSTMETIQKVNEAGGSAGDILKAGFAQYLASTAGGIVPFAKAGSPLLARIGLGAGTAPLVGEVTRMGMNAAMPDSMQQAAPGIDDLLIQAISGGLFGGMVHGEDAGAVASRLRQQAAYFRSEAGVAHATLQGEQTLRGLSALVQEGKLRERDPQTFKQLVADISDDSNVDGVWVDAKSLAEVLDAHGADGAHLAEVLPTVASQMREGLQTEGQVRISLDDYATHIMGSGVEEALIPHLRIAPDGPTIGEAQQHQTEQVAKLTEQAQQMVDEHLAKAPDATAFRASADRVEKSIREQLDASGRFPAEVNRQYAALHRAFYSAAAAQEGRLPEQLMAEHPVRVAAEGTGPLGQGGEPHARITGEEFGPLAAPTKELRATARSWYEANLRGQSFKNDSLGREIKVADGGKAFATSAEPDKVRLFAALPQLLEHGELVSSKAPDDPQRYQNVRAYHWLEGTVQVGDRALRVGVTVKEDDKGHLYYNHTPLKREGFATPENRATPATKAGGVSKEEGTLDQTVAPAPGGVNLHVLGDAGTVHRGSFDPATKTITLLKDADLSTFLHESGHFFLDTLAARAARADAPAQVKADMASLLKWFGHDSLEQWHAMGLDGQRESHERFARGFEAYLLEGKAPTPELRTLFGRFSAWLTQAYRSLLARAGAEKALQVELSPEVRGVMDRLLASENAIRDAEAAHALRPLFEEKPAEMTEEAWTKYQADHADATREAVSELQGKSIADMKWLSNAKGRALKALQREAKSARAEVTAEVTKQVDAQPAFQAKAYLERLTHPHRAAMADWRAERDLVPDEQRDAWVKDHPAPEKPHGAIDDWQAARDAEEARVAAAEKARVTEGKKGLEKGQALAKARREVANNVDRALIEWERDHPRPTDARTQPDLEVVADKFGFDSAHSMLEAIHDAGDRKDVIQAMTDQRMLHEHGELVDENAVQRAVDVAVHNDLRAKVLARELNALAKATGSPRLLAKAAEEAATSAIDAKKLSDLRPKQYGIAEGKAGRAADAAFKKGDTQTAAVQKRAQLLNNRLAKAALDAADMVRKGLAYQARFDRPAVRDKLDGEFLRQIDRIRELVDFRKNPGAGVNAEKVASLAEFAHALRRQGYEPQVADWLATLTTPRPYKSLTVAEFRGAMDAIRSLEFIARDRHKVRVGEQMATVREVVDNQLLPRLAERGERFTKHDLIDHPQMKVDGAWAALTHWLGVRARTIHADLLGSDFKFNRYDLHAVDGPFRKLILDRFTEANYRKVDLTQQVSDRAGKIGEALGKDWQHSLYDVLPNSTLMDPDIGGPLKMTRGRLLGIARHVGNESNFDKLTKGWGWDPQQVVAYLHEHMRAADWRATQAHWDSFDPLWHETEAMVHRIGGVAPPKIPPREFTVKTRDGETIHLKGGYSPLDYDPIRSKLSVRMNEFSLDESDQVQSAPRYTATTTSNGSLNARQQGYTDRVSLDFHGAEARIRDTIHDLAYREVLLDTSKIIKDAAFRDGFQSAYGREEYQALVKWLRAIRDTYAVEPDSRMFEKAMGYARQGVVLTGIGYRLSTVLKHGGAAAFKSLGYVGTGPGAVYFAQRVAQTFVNPRRALREASAMFPEIRARTLQMDRDYRVGNRSMYEGEDWRARNDRYGHAMVAWSDALSAMPLAWAAYDLATIKGVPESMGGTGKPMTRDEAIRYADMTVRQAHGSALEVSRSNFLQARGAKGFFGALYGFMNNTYGQLSDLIDKSTSQGHFSSHPVAAARLTACLIIPALLAQWLKDGGPDDAGDESPAGWTAKAIGGEVAGTVPFVRDAWSLLENGRSGQVAPMQAITDAVNSAKDIWGEAQGKDTRLIQDLSNAMGEWGHIAGLGEVGHILQHARDVAEGHKDPSLWHAAVGGKEERH